MPPPKEATLNLKLENYCNYSLGEKIQMKPTSIIYWTRALFGVVAALISTLLRYVASIDLLRGMTIAILIYIVTYYVYKARYLTVVEKPSKIFTTGIGAYFLTWIVAWVFFYTILIQRGS